jgi:hypothetical protein
MQATTQYPELMLGYESDGKLSKGVCSLCGEDLLGPDPPFNQIRDAILPFP